MQIILPILMLLGLSAIAYGPWWLFTYYDFKWNGVPVILKVNGHKQSSNDSGSTSPEYEVVAGPYRGKTSISAFGTPFGFQSKGNELQGFYIPPSERIESQASLSIMLYCSIFFIISAICIWSFVGFYYFTCL